MLLVPRGSQVFEVLGGSFHRGKGVNAFGCVYGQQGGSSVYGGPGQPALSRRNEAAGYLSTAPLGKFADNILRV